MPDDHHEPTRLLARLKTGDANAAEELMPLVYGELRGLARKILAEQRPGHTLQPTELIHEAWLRLCGSSAEFEDRRHFLRVAARAMRYAIVDHARGKGAQKRGQGRDRITFDEQLFEVVDRSQTVLAIDEALTRLGENDERLAQIVELKFFGGLTHEEIAAALETSLRSVERGWRLARAWLVGEIEERGG